MIFIKNWYLKNIDKSIVNKFIDNFRKNIIYCWNDWFGILGGYSLV